MLQYVNNQDYYKEIKNKYKQICFKDNKQKDENFDLNNKLKIEFACKKAEKSKPKNNLINKKQLSLDQKKSKPQD